MMTPSFADAQPAAPTEQTAGTQELEPARAHLVVFIDALPAPGVGVSTEAGTSGITSESGAVTLDLIDEGEHALHLTIPRQLVPDAPGQGLASVDLKPIRFVRGETVEIIVTLSPAGNVESVDIEGAEDQAETRAEREAFEKAQAEKPKGTVTGMVVAIDGKGPVAGARVFVRGATVEAETDARGRFTLELPEGEYALSVIHPDYSTEAKEGVQVKGEQTVDVSLELTPASVTLDDFVITAPHVEGGVASLIEERRESSNVSDIIGAEEMSRAGASDAAGALKRVTGINVIGGRFVYVRGMGERYSSTLLNGHMLPSPDPERRVVPLDLFPVQVLESVVVQKTYSPDMPGEFGGGVVQLRTRAYPEKLTLQMGASVSVNTQTTFRKAPTYVGGDLDWLGTDDGTRELPSEVAQAGQLERSNPLRPGVGYSDAELAAFGRQLNNNLNTYRSTVPPDRKVSITAGNTFDIGPVPVGVLVSGLYSDSYQVTHLNTRRFNASDASEGGLQESNVFDVETLQRTVSSGGILSVGSEYLNGQEIKSTTLLARVTDIQTDLVEGFDDDLSTDIRRARLRFIERQLLTEQINGKQTIAPLNDAVFDWRYAYATASLDDPDRREYRYVLAEPFFEYVQDPSLNRNFATLKDWMHSLAADYTQPFSVWSDLEARAKLGAMLVTRRRDFEIKRYKFTPRRAFPGDYLRQSPEDIFVPEAFSADGFRIQDASTASDVYAAEQTIQAGYAMAEIPIVERLEASGGLRLEHSEQSVNTFDPFDPEERVPASLDDTDLLPAGTLTWRFTDEMALRGGYGRTVSRPDFRELSPAQFLDTTTNTLFIGNPDLERATIQNFDLRWEWYFSTDELLSFGGFYKSFDRPIELVVRGGSIPSFTYDNADSATNWGLELEGRRRLGFASDHLEDFFIASNLAFIQSNVELGDAAAVATSQRRPLQGQAPYVVNAQLGYDDTVSDDGIGLTATLLYNVTGPWIAQVGREGAPDIYTEPFHQLDFTLAQQLPGGFRLSLKASNILDPEQRLTQGSRVAQRFKRGRDFSLGLSWAL